VSTECQLGVGEPTAGRGVAAGDGEAAGSQRGRGAASQRSGAERVEHPVGLPQVRAGIDVELAEQQFRRIIGYRDLATLDALWAELLSLGYQPHGLAGGALAPIDVANGPKQGDVLWISAL